MTKYQIKKNIDDTKTFQYRYRNINGRQKTKSFRAKNTTKNAEKAALKELKDFAKEMEANKTLGIATDESSTKFSD
ncbi:hypothetical protein KHQ81_06280 [Mycoplasmatota bacterium]|nr:hypothetical protein KHQ81_06280 [Mycoplasmatota bacterium]